ncbi:hypothetical protein JCM10599A_04190 [Paraburkholderia kururiensis]
MVDARADHRAHLVHGSAGPVVEFAGFQPEAVGIDYARGGEDMRVRLRVKIVQADARGKAETLYQTLRHVSRQCFVLLRRQFAR